MRKLNVNEIRKTIERLCTKANTKLRPDVLGALKKAYRLEKSRTARDCLKAIIDNAHIASAEGIAICQDTGMVVVSMELGDKIKLTGGSLDEAVSRGIRDCYKKWYFRKSVVKDPLSRINTKDNTPCVLYVKITKGSKLNIRVTPKGFGSENKSSIKMFKPTTSLDKIKGFIIETVKDAGAGACPPFVVGVGIGGTFDKAALLAKEALSRPINKRNPKSHIMKLEKELLSTLNKSGIGPMGLGGRTTALGVNVLSYPTHIAGMPVAVNLSCHATRGAQAVL